MTPDEAYEEALRRIREAETTGAVELDLSGLQMLNRLPPELERLTLLRSLNISGCWQLNGDLAALTQVCVDPAMPEWGFQELTAVARPHRGHRLGLLVKLAMLDLLAAREPQVTQIDTGNADGNQHMIAINEQLGFRVLSRWPSWELDVAGVPPDLPGHG